MFKRPDQLPVSGYEARTWRTPVEEVPETLERAWLGRRDVTLENGSRDLHTLGMVGGRASKNDPLPGSGYRFGRHVRTVLPSGVLQPPRQERDDRGKMSTTPGY